MRVDIIKESDNNLPFIFVKVAYAQD